MRKCIIVKMSAIFIVLILVFGSLAGCNIGITESSEEQIDEERSQIRVGNYDAGYGTDWLRALKVMFEDEYKEESFEEGKKGVQIIIDADKMLYAGDTLMANLESSQNEIFFSDMIYYRAHVGGNRQKFYDITDVVTESLDDVGESGTILDKMTEEQQNFYSYEGKYYALPHYSANDGLHYNVELFEDNLLYFSDNPDNGNDGFIKKMTDKFGTGPDGEYDTYDDGMPRTYDEFFKLCARMKQMNISPLTVVGGRYPAYVSAMLSALWADYEGAEQAKLRFTMDGTATNVVEDFNKDSKPILKDVTITSANAYELYRQAGTYYALDFMEKLVKNDCFASKAFDTSSTHLSIQADFIYTGIVPGAEKIGMLAEGSYWYEEAKDAFNNMSSMYQNADRQSRRFAVMPLPKATEDRVGTGTTLYDGGSSIAFINASVKSDKIDLVKLFFKWCHTDRALQAYTVYGNSIKNFKYELTKKQCDSLSYWVKSSWDYRHNADICYGFSLNPVYIANPMFSFAQDHFYSTVNNELYKYPCRAMMDFGVTAREYFDGMKTYYSEGFWSRYL